MSFTVTEKAMRPASPKRECFYCRRRIGANHNPQCVLIQRPIKLAIELTVNVPVNYEADDIEYWFQEGNGRQEIARFFNDPEWIAGDIYSITNGEGEPFLDE